MPEHLIVRFPRIDRRSEKSPSQGVPGDSFTDIETTRLQQAVERTYGCTAIPGKAMPVRKLVAGKTEWEGLVQVFELLGHPKAIRAYAWFSSEEENPGARAIETVLHTPQTSSARKAVHAAVAPRPAD